MDRPTPRTTASQASVRHSGSPAAGPTRPKKKKSKAMPGWGKALIIAGCLFGSLLFGLIIGYNVIGNEPVAEVFSISTWKHLFDLVFG